MTDQYLAPQSASPEFGPTPDDVDAYSTMLGRIDAFEPGIFVFDKRDPAGIGFDVRTTAELISTEIDRGRVGISTNFDVGSAGFDERSRLRIGLERYIPSVLGLNVGKTEIDARACTAGADVSLPTVAELPSLPTHNHGKFYDEHGTEISQVRADAVYAGHFIANNSDHFSKPGAFEDLFRRVVEQAESGQLEVRDRVGDLKGAMSLTRQVARVLGYEVGSFQAGSTQGTYTMPVAGIRKGFDIEVTHFKRK